MAHKRTEIIHDLHNTKQALAASEKRGRKAIRRLRGLEKLLEPLKDRMRTWADMPIADDMNASRIMTVGQCRKILALLDDQDQTSDEDKEQAA